MTSTHAAIHPNVPDLVEQLSVQAATDYLAERLTVPGGRTRAARKTAAAVAERVILEGVATAERIRPLLGPHFVVAATEPEPEPPAVSPAPAAPVDLGWAL